MSKIRNLPLLLNLEKGTFLKVLGESSSNEVKDLKRTSYWFIKYLFHWEHTVPENIKKIQRLERDRIELSDKDHSLINKYDFGVFFKFFLRAYIIAVLVAVVVKFSVRPILYNHLGYDIEMIEVWDQIDKRNYAWLLMIEPSIFGIIFLRLTRKMPFTETLFAANFHNDMGFRNLG